ncbi:hypothetical protein AB0O76_07150 [Streptomyces sp. NPDC086554]|uniref:hypothetical protein n=1 Tax=Streptomyces sp. NPDC086554 TaxID=3154864 RepID=UPI00343E92A4
MPQEEGHLSRSDQRPGRSAFEYCYWARLSSTSGDLGSVIANNGGDGAAVVTIQPGDKAFETTGCQTWKKTS